MKILVTGATGFIGSHLIRELLKHNNNEIIATSRDANQAKKYNWFSRVTYISHDIGNKEKKNLFKYFGKPDSMIHLAWPGLPNYSKNFHIIENLSSDIKFLDNLIDNGLKNLSVTGTCFEYGMREGKLSEDMKTHTINEYSKAKNSLRRHLENKCKMLKTKLIWLRPFYVYGIDLRKSSLITQLEKAVKLKKPEFNMTEGNQIRDFIDVLETAKLISKICLDDNSKGIYNVCSGNPISVFDFVKMYLKNNNYEIKLNRGAIKENILEPKAAYGCTKRINKYLI